MQDKINVHDDIMAKNNISKDANDFTVLIIITQKWK